jgi:hypothetical protein
MKAVHDIKSTELARVIQFGDLFPEQTQNAPEVATLLQV